MRRCYNDLDIVLLFFFSLSGINHGLKLFPKREESLNFFVNSLCIFKLHKTFCFKLNNLFTLIMAMVKKMPKQSSCKSKIWMCMIAYCNTRDSSSLGLGANFLHWNQNSKFWVTWPRIAESVYFLRKMCLFFNFWMIKFTIMFFLTFTHEISHLRSSACQKATIPSKNIQTEQN